jgi:hypothetical protein
MPLIKVLAYSLIHRANVLIEISETPSWAFTARPTTSLLRDADKLDIRRYPGKDLYPRADSRAGTER